MSSDKFNQDTKFDVVDSRQKGLYKIGGAAALTMLAIMVAQIIIFIVWPPPETVEGYFTLFQNNPLLGLLSLDFLYIVNNALLVLIYLALYITLKRTSKSSVAIALVLGLVGITAYFASNTAFEMLSLSNQYAVATTEVQRNMFLGAGQTMLEIYKGTAFNVYYILNAVVLLMFSFVMLRSDVFNKVIASVGIIAGVLMLIPSTAGTIGIYFSLTSLIPWAIWLTLFARRLFQLGRLG
jgi:hypothetical protein